MSVKRHTSYNIAGAIIPTVATLATVPTYLLLIGEDRYGVLIVLWTLLGYFGLFDLGLGRAVTHRVAAFKDRTALEREEVFWTAILLNLGLGCIGAVVLWISATFILGRFADVSGGLFGEVYAALPWIVLALPLLLVFSVMSAALMGREEFLAQNVVGIGTGLLIQVFPLVVAIHVGPALLGLVLAVLGARVLGGVALFGLCVRQFPVSLRPKISRSHVRPLFVFGGWVTVTSIVGPLLSTLDRVVIGAVAGAKAVTYYTVPFSLVSRISILPSSLSSALFPRFSSQDESDREDLFKVSLDILIVTVTPLVVVGMLVMEPFLLWWLGSAFAVRAAPVGEILVIGVWANCFATLPFSVLQGQGRPDLVAKIHFAELLPYLVLLWVALQWKGAVGAAVAWTLRVWVDMALLFWASHVRSVRPFIAGFALVAVAAAVTASTSGAAWQGLALRAFVVTFAFVWAWWVSPPTLKDSALYLVRRLTGTVKFPG